MSAAADLNLIPSVPVFLETDLRLRVAKKLSELISKAIGVSGKIYFELGGAQGIELAIKIARAKNPQSGYLTFEGGYHGRSPFTSQFSAAQRYRAMNGEWSISTARLPYPDCKQCRFGKDETTCNFECISFMNGLFSNEYVGVIDSRTKNGICAFLFESILNTGGIVKPHNKYLNTAVDLAKKHGALIIADEIFTGLYRTGKLFGFQHYDFTPDIIVMSKAITNGLVPLSCVWVKDSLNIEEVFPPGSHSSTYCNNLFAFSVLENVLNCYDSIDDIEDEISKKGGHLRNSLFKKVKNSSLIKSIDVYGLMGRVLLNKPIATELVEIAKTIRADNPLQGYHGAIFSASGLANNVISITPPFIISLDELDILIEILSEVIKEKEDSLYE